MKNPEMNFDRKTPIKCAHCGKARDFHKARTLHCPQGAKHRTFGYSWYSDTDTFKEATVATAKAAFVRPFRMGDVIKIKGKGQHVVHTVDFEGGGFVYSTHRSAWHSHSDCTLVRECDSASLTLLRKAIREENDGE